MDPYTYGFPSHLPLITKKEEMLISCIFVVMKTLFLEKSDGGVLRFSCRVYNRIHNKFPTVFTISYTDCMTLLLLSLTRTVRMD